LSKKLFIAGYLQRQLISWQAATRRRVCSPSRWSSAARAYQDARGMALLTAFGALFGAQTIYRRNLCTGRFAHAWHD
jgi:hypothetical protein